MVNTKAMIILAAAFIGGIVSGAAMFERIPALSRIIQLHVPFVGHPFAFGLVVSLLLMGLFAFVIPNPAKEEYSAIFSSNRASRGKRK